MNIHQLLLAARHPAAIHLPIEGELPSLGGATAWLNSAPLSAAGLRGKVVLIDFWTYTCINWLRTLPYVRAWAEKYQEHGVVVIGVHTPEFPFEHDLENVRRAAKDMKVSYPIAIDDELVSVDASGAEAAADWGSLRSAENYVGDERTENFASPGGAVLDTPHVYAVPERLRLNHWALAGDWTVERQAIVLHQANGRIADRFHARDLHLVMGPAARGTPVRCRVLVDGQPPGAAHGTDVDDQGNGTVTEQRLYQLIRQRGPVTEHTFEITFLDPGVQAYAFTFG